ncbi:MAG: glycosyltransferase [Epsilonproteobacteria bacterium]|nr:glycosyltransferase [Campylobacterota bacterium]
MQSKPITLSIVAPCYNEEEVLPEAKEELLNYLHKLIERGIVSKESFICFVDDGSRDRTWELIEKFAQDPHIKGLKLSRNFGQQNALLAGLFFAGELSDAVITLDVDLQDDIRLIEEMCRKFSEGYEVIYGARKKRETDTPFKKVTAQLFYRVMEKMGIEMVPNHAHYRLMSRRAVQWLKEFKEVNLFLRGIIPLIGLKSTTLYYERQKRVAGESKYSLWSLLELAWDGITNFSVIPLRFITFLGVLVLITSLILSVWALISKLNGSAVSGWTSMMLIVLFLGGVQMLSIGIIGEYIGKIYKETKRRPRFFVEKIEG